MDHNRRMFAQSTPTPGEFHRLRWLWGFALAALIALAVGVSFPPSTRYLVAAVVLALGFVVFVVPYWSDKIVFTSDGQLISNRAIVQPASVTQCRFAISVPAGRTPRFFVFAIYDGERGDVMPKCVIPIYGWRSHDRALLFRTFKTWLATTGATLDAPTQGRLDALAA